SQAWNDLAAALPCATITVSPTTLPNGTAGTAYSGQTLTASGGTAPYTFAVISGSLPSGLILSAGVISGTPTSAGSSTFTVTATDANGCTGTRSYTVSIAGSALASEQFNYST